MMDRKFKLKVDIIFLAQDVDDALRQVGYHFLSLGFGFDPKELQEIHTKDASPAIRGLEPTGTMSMEVADG